ncbi:MCE family protein [Saccharopolyspora sp. ID03-671]|uniref:MCE family protein n=1 Tax=Saccharopolyspora sp. ID03-671 TaxID=3073066 RepID=UPI0032500253
MKRNRLMLVQIALFALISIGCTVYVVTNVVRPHMISAPHHVTVRMPEASGITRDSLVTFRGVEIGAVTGVRIEDAGVSVLVAIDSSARVPASARAVIAMDTPMALQHLDLRADTDAGPFLRDGSVIQPERTARPLPLETLLTDFTAISDSVDPRDVDRLGEALATGLNGTGPELTRILDNSAELLRVTRENVPRLRSTLDNGRALVGPNGEQGDRLRVLAANLRSLTDQVRADEPQVRSLLATAPDTTRQVARLMADNEPSVTALLGNLVKTGQIVSVRGPAMQQALVSLPGTFGGLGRIVHGDTADFDLVITQGPSCVTPIERRSPTDTEPREPSLDWHCPGDDPRMGQRGAANAPRPMGTYDTTTGDTGAGFTLGTSGGQSEVLGSRSWYSIPLQGVR